MRKREITYTSIDRQISYICDRHMKSVSGNKKMTIEIVEYKPNSIGNKTVVKKTEEDISVDTLTVAEELDKKKYRTTFLYK